MWSLSPVPGTELLKPLELIAFCVLIRLPVGEPLIASGWGLVVRKVVITRLGLSVPPQPLEPGEGLEIEFNHQWPMS